MPVKKIRGETVASQDLEWGVEFESGFVHLCEDEDDAQLTAAMTDGEIRVRTVYTTDWAELAE